MFYPAAKDPENSPSTCKVSMWSWVSHFKNCKFFQVYYCMPNLYAECEVHLLLIMRNVFSPSSLIVFPSKLNTRDIKFSFLILLQEGWFAGQIFSGIESSSSRIIAHAVMLTNFCLRDKATQPTPFEGGLHINIVNFSPWLMDPHITQFCLIPQPFGIIPSFCL